MTERVMSVPEFARRMKVTRATVYRWIEKGGLPSGVRVEEGPFATRVFVPAGLKLPVEDV